MRKTFRQSWLSLLTFKNVFLAMITGGVWLIIPVIQILSTEYEISEQHLTVTKGLISRKVDHVEWIRVRDVRMVQGIAGRILNFGDVTVISTDQSHPSKLIKGITDPAALRSQILETTRKTKENAGVRLQEWL